MNKTYDFCGWATRNDILCSDGRTIRKDAFKDNDGQTVPLVWNHQHDGVANVLGHATLENRNEGVYAYCSFNETENGKDAREMVKHGDITALSIYANKLKHNGRDVVHGEIREVSLVLAGANIGAYIEEVVAHSSDAGEYEAKIYTGYMIDTVPLKHSEEKEESEESEDENMKMKENKEPTIQDVIDSMTEEQRDVLYTMVGKALEDGKDNNDDEDEDEEENEVKHNVFENDDTNNTLSHAETQAIFSDAKRLGSLKDAVLAHADNLTDIGTEGLTYGIGNVDYLFPDAHNLDTTPQFIQRDTGWVQKVMGKVHHTPFSRIKSQFADITDDEARAKGYIKGNKKKDEVFGLLKRTTTPTTIYKKQKLDRDDIVDITDFDVVAWIKTEMRGMLDEEIARAVLIGDGRLNSSDDKINESCIRPVLTDDDLFTLKYEVAYGSTETDEYAKAKHFIKSCIKARKKYKGSGNPTLYTTEDMVTDMLLIEDLNGRRIYDSIATLATALRVSEIVTVEVMEGLKRDSKNVLGVIVNMNDYTIGADKGGAINMFDDFDIDYNQQKYLIETRCSGALTKPFSAIVMEEGETEGYLEA